MIFFLSYIYKMVLFYGDRANTSHHPNSEDILTYVSKILEQLGDQPSWEYLMAKEKRNTPKEHWQIIVVCTALPICPHDKLEKIKRKLKKDKDIMPGSGYNTYSIIRQPDGKYPGQMLPEHPDYYEKLSYPLKEYAHLPIEQILKLVVTNMSDATITELAQLQKNIYIPKYAKMEKVFKNKKPNKPRELLNSFESYLIDHPWDKTHEDGKINLYAPGANEFVCNFLMYHYRMQPCFFDFTIMQKHYYLILNTYDPETLFYNMASRMHENNRFLMKNQYKEIAHNINFNLSELISNL